MSKKTLVIIGNGMVGHRYIEELIDKGGNETFNIIVFVKNLVLHMIESISLPIFLITPLKSSR